MPSTRPQRPYNVKYYQRNRQREIDRVMTRQRATLAFLRELRRVPCEDCGRRFLPHQMDFDHRDPSTKSFQVTDSGALLAARSRLLEEIAKCDVVCATCHAIRSYAQQAERWARRMEQGELIDTRRHIARRQRATRLRDLLLVLRDRGCLDCGERPPPCVMQFDHRDPREKKFSVSSSWCRSDSKIVEEARKCDIVCPNCHRHRSFKSRQRTAGVAQFG
jgi:hypothetical protein